MYIRSIVFLFLLSQGISAQTMDTVYDNKGVIFGYGPSENGNRFGLWSYNIVNGNPWKTIEYKSDSTAIIKWYTSQPGTGGVIVSPIESKNTTTLYSYDYRLVRVDTGYYDINYNVISNGFSTSYYSDGKIGGYGLMREGLREGIWKLYYSDGSICNVLEYENGKYNGVFQTYFEGSGTKPWINGQTTMNAMVGEWTEYYENGKIKSKGTYAGDIQPFKVTYDIVDSLQKLYPELPIKIYSMNQMPLSIKSGIWMYYNENGKMIRKEKWKKGKVKLKRGVKT